MKKSKVAPYLYMLPNLVIFSVFIIVPAISGFYYSLTKYDGLNPPEFVGLRNYIKLFNDPQFLGVIERTVIYTVSVVALIYCISLGVALILTNLKKSLNFFRAVYYLPVMISFVIAGLAWQWFLSDHFGLISFILSLFGIEDFSFLLSSFGANLSTIMVTVWCRFGYFMVIFFVAIVNINNSLFEAADIDGASATQKFLYITFPMLKPTSVLVLILSIIDTLKTYPLIVSLTGGGPVDKTTYIVQYIYETGFVSSKLGYASAMSVLLFVVVVVISTFIMKISRGGEIE